MKVECQQGVVGYPLYCTEYNLADKPCFFLSSQWKIGGTCPPHGCQFQE